VTIFLVLQQDVSVFKLLVAVMAERGQNFDSSLLSTHF
jgi:hypothetical protein